MIGVIKIGVHNIGKCIRQHSCRFALSPAIKLPKSALLPVNGQRVKFINITKRYQKFSLIAASLLMAAIAGCGGGGGGGSSSVIFLAPPQVLPTEESPGNNVIDDPVIVLLDDDNDGVANTNDNCVADFNPDQLDSDFDGMGDACEADSDGDGLEDGLDNCRFDFNPDQLNIDADGLGDACDDDRDNDGVVNVADNCPNFPNESQLDTDADFLGNPCDDTPLGDDSDQARGADTEQTCVSCFEPVGDTSRAAVASGLTVLASITTIPSDVPPPAQSLCYTDGFLREAAAIAELEGAEDFPDSPDFAPTVFQDFGNQTITLTDNSGTLRSIWTDFVSISFGGTLRFTHLSGPPGDSLIVMFQRTGAGELEIIAFNDDQSDDNLRFQLEVPLLNPGNYCIAVVPFDRQPFIATEPFVYTTEFFRNTLLN